MRYSWCAPNGKGRLRVERGTKTFAVCLGHPGEGECAVSEGSGFDCFRFFPGCLRGIALNLSKAEALGKHLKGGYHKTGSLPERTFKMCEGVLRGNVC